MPESRLAATLRNSTAFRSMLRYGAISLTALAVFAAILLLAGKNPLKAYVDTFSYTLANAYGFSELLVRMTPLLLTAVAASESTSSPR